MERGDEPFVDWLQKIGYRSVYHGVQRVFVFLLSAFIDTLHTHSLTQGHSSTVVHLCLYMPSLVRT
jgi:hypothetical protein